MCVSGLRWGITMDTVCNEGVVLTVCNEGVVLIDNSLLHNQPPVDSSRSNCCVVNIHLTISGKGCICLLLYIRVM